MQTAVFTRDNPCTKVHLHNAFVATTNNYAPVSVVYFRSIAGTNSQKYLLKSGYAREYQLGGVDMIELTNDGREWLRKGLQSHLTRHPEDSAMVFSESPEIAKARGSKPAPAAKRIIRRR